MDAGKIIIKTIIDNTKLTKGIKEAKKKLVEYKAEAEKKEAKVETNASESTKKEELNTDKLIKKIGKLVIAYGALKVAKKVVSTPLAITKDFGKALIGISGTILSIGKSFLEWGLKALGVKSIINQIKDATNDVLNNNKQVSDQVAIMKGALASAIEPLVARIVNLVYTLASFINGIVKSITGKDLFASAQKNLNKGVKSAKELKKQLAGFDEMNVLSDNSSKGSGDTGVSLGTPDPQMLSFLDDLKKLFLEGDIGKIAQILSEKLVGALNMIADKIASIDWSSIGTKVSEFLTNIDFSGIFVGLVRVFGEAVLALQDFILAIDWGKLLHNFGQGIADAIGKIGEYIGKIKFSELGAKLTEAFTSVPWGDIGSNILTALWNAVMGIKDLILGIDWGEVATTLSDTLMSIYGTVTQLFSEIDWESLGETIIENIVDFISNVDWGGLLLSIFEYALTVEKSIIQLTIGLISSIIKNCWKFVLETDWIKLGIDIVMGILQGLATLGQAVFDIFGALVEGILNILGIHSPSTVFADMGKNIVEGLVNGIKALVNTVINIFKTIWNNIKSVFSVVGTFFYNIFKGAVDKIKTVFSTIVTIFKTIWENVSKVIKTPINIILGAIENMVNTIINGLNGLIKMVNKIKFDVPDWVPIIGGKSWGFNIPEAGKVKLPRLAQGGIVNLPSRGVPVGSAIAGERGQEGVIPLTDSQQMELLGEAIGRYITVNANITNTMNGRVISRELMKIQNENDFAYNR